MTLALTKNYTQIDGATAKVSEIDGKHNSSMAEIEADMTLIETEVNGQFDTATGHDHDGSNSKLVSVDMDNVTDGDTYVKTHNDYTDAEVSKLAGIATGAVADHVNIANKGTNTHAQIDTHIAANEAHGETVVIKAGNETVNNSAVLQNDDHLLFAAAANSKYMVHMYLLVDFKASSDFKCTFTGPAGASGYLSNFATAAGVAYAALGGDLAVTSSNSAACMIKLSCILITAGAAGNFQFQWAQNTAAVEDTIVQANSVMTIKKIA